MPSRREVEIAAWVLHKRNGITPWDKCNPDAQAEYMADAKAALEAAEDARGLDDKDAQIRDLAFQNSEMRRTFGAHPLLAEKTKIIEDLNEALCIATLELEGIKNSRDYWYQEYWNLKGENPPE